MALLPFIVSSSILYGAINAKFFFLIAAVDALLLWSAYCIYKGGMRVTRAHRPLLYALALLLLAQYATMFLGVHPGRSWWSDLFWMSGVLFLTHIAALSVMLGFHLSRADWTLVRRAIAVSAGVFSVATIVGTEGLGFSGTFFGLDFSDSGLSFGNGTYAGVYLLLAFILSAIELSRTAEGTWRRILLGCVTAVALSPVLVNIGILFGKTPIADAFANPVVLLGSSRASSATLILLLVFLAGRYVIKRFMPEQTGRKMFLVWSTVLCASIVTGIGLLFTPGSLVQKAYVESSTAARLIVWESSAAAITERPVWGWGPENFNYALERHFDNRLFLNENIGEIWFDRAHNFFVDTLVTTGILGLMASLFVMAAYLFTVHRAGRRNLIGETETALLLALPMAHVLQLQTGFDTVATYGLLGFIAGYALWLENQLAQESKRTFGLRRGGAYALAALAALFAVASFKLIIVDELSRQTALLAAFRTSGNAAAQQDAIQASLTRDSSFEALRVSSASFLKGALMSVAQNPGNTEKVRRVLDFMKIYEARYEKYLRSAPDHYRARTNYAYLLLIKTTLGEDRLDETKALIRDSYRLSPKNPLTYVLDSVAELYSGNLKEADRLMQAGLALNPDIEFTQEAAAYLEKQKKIFPNITVLKIGNL